MHCNSLTIAFILPVLVGLWKITPGEIGLLISAGFVGQLLGAITLGWAAEKYGRQRVLQFSLLIMAAFAAACAMAWSYTSLLVFRALQGVGLGGEVPVAATYLNEFTRAPYRGRFLLLLQWMFAIRVAVTSLVATWLVPNFGWQSMFWLGILPALLAIGLRWLIPESPRWLAGQGRLDEADAALSTIEASVPDAKQAPLPSDVPAVIHQRAGWADLFKGIYRKRTFCAWTIAFCTSFIGYGLITWLPTIFRTVYQLPIAQALQYGLIINTVGLAGPLCCMLLIDTFGRRLSFALGIPGGRNLHGGPVVDRRCPHARRGLNAGFDRLLLFGIPADRNLRVHSGDLSNANARAGHRYGQLISAYRLNCRTHHRWLHTRQ